MSSSSSLVAVFALLCASTGAFVVPSSSSSSSSSSSASSLRMVDDRSPALPFDKRPPNLDGTLPGDVGFDPAGFTSNPPRPWLIGGEGRSLKWYREAEIVHCRVSMLAALGFVFPEFYHLPGNAAVGVDVFSNTNPIEAIQQVPQVGLWQIAATIFAIEAYRISRVIRGDAEPGDLGLGQGEGRWNPFGFNYSEEDYFKLQTNEIKNGRLAMIAWLGMIAQTQVSKVGVITYLNGIFEYPGDKAHLPTFFPEGL